MDEICNKSMQDSMPESFEELSSGNKNDFRKSSIIHRLHPGDFHPALKSRDLKNTEKFGTIVFFSLHDY